MVAETFEAITASCRTEPLDLCNHLVAALAEVHRTHLVVTLVMVHLHIHTRLVAALDRMALLIHMIKLHMDHREQPAALTGVHLLVHMIIHHKDHLASDHNINWKVLLPLLHFL